MNIKFIQKFDKFIQKTTNKQLNTFDEISEIIIKLITMKENANHNNLMQRISLTINFAATQDIQSFLTDYFEFHNSLIEEFESIDSIEDDAVFNKKLMVFTKNLFSIIKKEDFQNKVEEFTQRVVDVVLDEYSILDVVDGEHTLKTLTKVFSSKDIALLFIGVIEFLRTLKKDNLEYEQTLEIASSIFVFCMAMNTVRKVNTQNSLQNNSSVQKPANSIAYNMGRNDPCPCGSGRKYKKCCLSENTPKPLSMIKFEEPEDIMGALSKDELHKFYAIWSRFLNFVSKVYAGVSGGKPIKIYDKSSKGEYFLSDAALNDSYYLIIRSFLAEYFFTLIEHFIDDNRVSLKNINILYEVRDTYKNIDVFSFEMFGSGNAIFYNPEDKSCFYVHKTFFDYSKVFPKATLLETMFFSYKGRIITDGVASSPHVEMGENIQNTIQEEYEEYRKKISYSLAINEPPKQTVYQLKISIKGAKPPIWRRVLVHSSINFEELHSIIQDIFNWKNDHLYMFMGERYSYASRYFLEESMFYGEREVPADEYGIKMELVDVKDKIIYIYDFGDNWKHEIVLEKILEDDLNISYPICTGGKREGPIEDCGGIYSYNEIVQAIENPTFQNQYLLGEDGENYYEDFVPSHFDKDEINNFLKINE